MQVDDSGGTQVPGGMFVAVGEQGIKVLADVHLAPAGGGGCGAGLALERRVCVAQDGLAEVLDAVRDVIQVVVVPGCEFVVGDAHAAGDDGLCGVLVVSWLKREIE